MIKHVPIEKVRPHRSVRVRQSDIPASYLALCQEEGAVLEPSLCTYNLVADEYTLMGHPWNWHAAQCLMYATIPVIVLQGPESVFTPMFSTHGDGSDNDLIEWATTLHRALEEQGITVTELAKKMSLNRSTLAHTLQLRKLSTRCITAYRCGQINKGHAKKLAYLDESRQDETLDWMQRRLTKPTTRDLQKYLSRNRSVGTSNKTEQNSGNEPNVKKDPDVVRYEKKISEHFGCSTEIVSGKLQIDFGSNYEVLEGVLEKSGFT